MDSAGTLKIADFGLAVVFRHPLTGQRRLLNEKCGTSAYVAPEVSPSQIHFCLPPVEPNQVLEKHKPYEAEPLDLWGMGVILFCLLTGGESQTSEQRVD